MYSLEITDASAAANLKAGDENLEPYKEISANGVRLWKLLSTISPHLSTDFPILHPNRSNVIFVLALPPNLPPHVLFAFISAHSNFPRDITIVNHNKIRSAIVTFSSQIGADTFFINSLGEPFSPDLPALRCIPIFLASIVCPLLTIVPTQTVIEDCQREFPLPVCPICFQYFDPLISSYLFSATIDDVSVESYRNWGSPDCQTCKVVFNQNAECCCGQKDRLWVCMECGHVGCGRDSNRHAIIHFQQSNHRFSLRFSDRWLWDYVSGRSVDRSFQKRSIEANEGLISEYKKSLLSGVGKLFHQEEEAVGRLRASRKEEMDKLLTELSKEEEEEKKADEKLTEAESMAQSLRSIKEEIRQIKAMPEMVKFEQLTKENQYLKFTLDKLNKRFNELCGVLENRDDVTNKVILDMGK